MSKFIKTDDTPGFGLDAFGNWALRRGSVLAGIATGSEDADGNLVLQVGTTSITVPASGGLADGEFYLKGSTSSGGGVEDPSAGAGDESSSSVFAMIGDRRVSLDLSFAGYSPIIELRNFKRRTGETHDGPRLQRAIAAVPEGGALYIGGIFEIIWVSTAEGFVDRSVNLNDFDNRAMFGHATIRQTVETPVGRTLLRGHFHDSKFGYFTLDGNCRSRFPDADTLAEKVALYFAESELYNLKQCTNVHAYYITGIDAHQDGFDTDDCINCLMYRCTAKDNFGEGFHLTGEGAPKGDYCWNSACIECYSEHNGHVRRAAGDPYGNGYSTSGKGNYIINCKSLNDARGIYVGTTEGQIRGNTVIDPIAEDGTSENVGIIVKEPARGNRIDGNTVQWTNTSTAQPRTGIRVEPPNNDVYNNYIKNSTYGIRIIAANVWAYNNRINTAASAGIYFSGNPDYAFATGNVIDSATTYGIRADSAKAVIKDNIIRNPSSHAIELRAGNAVVTGNHVYGGFSGGVRGFGATGSNCVVKDNVIYAASGVTMHGSATGNVVAANVVNGTLVPLVP